MVPSRHRTKPSIFIVKKWNKIQNIYQIYGRKYVNLRHENRIKISSLQDIAIPASFVDKITVSPGKTGCDI